MMNFLLDDKRYVALVGLTGCGKTTFANLLAGKLGLKVLDTDDMIVEMSGQTIPELFEISESHFRDWEEKALASIAPDDNLVVACGGGIVLREANREILGKRAIVVYIDRPPELIVSQIDTTGRPLLKTGAEQVFRLHEERKSLYEEVADVIIPNDSTIEAALQLMVDAIEFLL